MALRNTLLAGALAAMLGAYASAAPQLPTSFVQKAKAEHAEEQIRDGSLSFSRGCGWIDWGHAGGTGPKSLVEAVLKDKQMYISEGDMEVVREYAKKHRLSLTKYMPIVYYQSMGKNALGVSAQVGTRTIYLVKKGLSRKTREGVAWRIFKEVSEHFEHMQGRAPYSLIPSTAASSFGVGDLTGNKIAFYRALRGYSRQQLEGICRPYDVQESLEQFARQQQNPARQGKWRRLPRALTVSTIPRGIVLTVEKDIQFVGPYK